MPPLYEMTPKKIIISQSGGICEISIVKRLPTFRRADIVSEMESK